MKTVLITGAYGFLGRFTALVFKKHNYRVIGIGHGQWGSECPEQYGIDVWLESSINHLTLRSIQEDLFCVVHCAGGSSVQSSLENPLEDYEKTVSSSIAVLEYIRVFHPKSRFIYPSSAAVYGSVANRQIDETFPVTPISPYGYYKNIVESLGRSYACNYDLPVSIIRFFSIYGEGLRKQLLWDACSRLSVDNKNAVEFYGDGTETRDWIHVKDAAELIFCCAISESKYECVNGGDGVAITNKRLFDLLSFEYGRGGSVAFNGLGRDGDPKYYWADISKAVALGWKPQISLTEGIRRYVGWYKSKVTR